MCFFIAAVINSPLRAISFRALYVLMNGLSAINLRNFYKIIICRQNRSNLPAARIFKHLWVGGGEQFVESSLVLNVFSSFSLITKPVKN